MSKLVLDTGEDFPEAAARHLDDATALQSEGRHDNAAYLSGYVVECVLKTVIRIEMEGHPEVHDLTALSRRASGLAALPGAQTARHAASMSASTHRLYEYGEKGWSESMRYRPSGHVPDDVAAEWLDEAEKVYDRVVGSLRLDGVV